MADEPVSDERLAQIRARVEAATPGPWEQPAYPVGGMVYRLIDRSPDGLIAVCERSTDAAFIAHAHEDIPALLAEVERLRATQNEARDLIDRLSEDLADHAPIAHDWLIDDANAWLAKNPKIQQP